VLLDYGDALTLAGHQVHAVIRPDAAIRPALELRAAAWHPLPHLGEWDPIAMMRLRRLLRTQEADICIAHGNRAATLLERAGASPIIGALGNYKMHCGDLAAVCAPTRDLSDYARRQGVTADRLYHVPNMVRVPVIPPRRPMRSPPIIGAMGRFVAKKGFEIFVAALAHLAARGLVFHAILGGDGEEAARLKHLAAENGIAERVSFPGWIKDKQAFFHGIDLFCLPSHHEPFGIVLLEAMAQALPIVTTASEGPREIVRNGVDAIVTRIGDSSALADALQMLLTNWDRAIAIGEQAYHLVRERYDLPRVAVQLDNAVRQVASRHGAGQEQRSAFAGVG
jgi:glycosyltransferase involved in cell wall biosynthesis